VADEKTGDDKDSGRNKRDLDENQDQAVEICLRHRSVPGQRLLELVEKRAAPVVESDRDLHAEVGCEQDEDRAEDRPELPFVGRIEKPEGRKGQRPDCVVDIKPEKGLGVEITQTDDWFAFGFGQCKAHGRTERITCPVPDKNSQTGPEQDRGEEDFRFREKGFKHGRDPELCPAGGT
jgi:hypothetical protein